MKDGLFLVIANSKLGSRNIYGGNRAGNVYTFKNSIGICLSNCEYS